MADAINGDGGIDGGAGWRAAVRQHRAGLVWHKPFRAAFANNVGLPRRYRAAIGAKQATNGGADIIQPIPCANTGKPGRGRIAQRFRYGTPRNNARHVLQQTLEHFRQPGAAHNRVLKGRGKGKAQFPRGIAGIFRAALDALLGFLQFVQRAFAFAGDGRHA